MTLLALDNPPQSIDLNFATAVTAKSLQRAESKLTPSGFVRHAGIAKSAVATSNKTEQTGQQNE